MDNVEQDLRNTRERETTDNVSDNEPHTGPRHPRNDDQNDFPGANFKNIKLEALTFDSQLDPQTFLDLISDIDHYFNWYDMWREKGSVCQNEIGGLG